LLETCSRSLLMHHFTLYFASTKAISLVRSEFTDGNGTKLESVRGKTSGAFGTAGTFQWTQAVIALCCLIIKTKYLHVASKTTDAFIAGYKDSFASSLDYAISKQPHWLCDMFGGKGSDNPIIRRLFKRTNPERKRAGPVYVKVNNNILSPEHIMIYVDDKLVQSAKQYLEILEQLDPKAVSEDPVLSAAIHAS
jgi:hypothetical protein